MNQSVWRIAVDTSNYSADDLSGEGAKRSGGRWNRVGLPMVYCSSNIALCVLETIVHIETDDLPLNRYLVEIQIPESIWKSRDVLAHPTVGWDARPCSATSLNIGATWMQQRKSALLFIPSVIVPEEFNILINPLHPDSKFITPHKVRHFDYGRRLTVAKKT